MDIDKLLADSSEETVATKETVSSEENVGIESRCDYWETNQKTICTEEERQTRGGGNSSCELVRHGFNLDAGDNAKFL